MRNILGISLGTKLLGIAVLYDDELSDFRIRTFYGRWTDKKRHDLNRTVREAIVRYEITAIAIKTPLLAYCSPNMNDLLSDIQRLSEQLHIKVTVCTIARLKEQYSCNNKQELADAIIRKYPHHKRLTKLLVPDKEHRNAYHARLFEAIACAEIEKEIRH